MNAGTTAARLGALLLAHGAACGGDRLVVGETQGGSAVATEFSQPVDSESGCADEVLARADLDECWPTRHVGRWHGFVSENPRYSFRGEARDFPTVEVSVEIERDGTGRFALGLPEPHGWSEETLRGACRDLASSPECGSGGALLTRFAYPLGGMAMAGGPNGARWDDPRLSFRVLIAEPWSAFCARQTLNVVCPRAASCEAECTATVDAIQATAGAPPTMVDCWLAPASELPCACDPAGCRALEDAVDFELSLSSDGLAMRGRATSASAGQVSNASVELVRQ